MTKDEKTTWVNALRSGKYKQGYGTLKREAGGGFPTQYCCLGVYCEVMEIPSKKLNPDSVSYHFIFGPNDDDKHNGALPNSILSSQVQGSLIAFNDTDHLNFDQIAGWIEDHVQTED